MSSLQEVYDFYLSTSPSPGKRQSALNLLIQACKAMNVNSAEDINEFNMQQLPIRLDEFFADNRQKALMAKSMLSELIGRYGPRNGWEVILKILMLDPDENLRNYAWQSLEYSAIRQPQVVLNFFNYLLESEDWHDLAAISRTILRMYKSGLKKQVTNWLDELIHTKAEMSKQIFQSILNYSPEEKAWEKSFRELRTTIQQKYSQV